MVDRRFSGGNTDANEIEDRQPTRGFSVNSIAASLKIRKRKKSSSGRLGPSTSEMEVFVD